MKYSLNKKYAEFNRNEFDPTENFTYIGTGEIGGKASGLAFIKNIIESNFSNHEILVEIPRLIVITTDFFDRFMEENDLYEIAQSDLPDYIIAHKFQDANLPVPLLGDLREILDRMHMPLAIRSSSLMEDALHEPFAGIYETKMIPNNQPSPDERFKKLDEAIKLVYASTFFKKAKDYIKGTSHKIQEEKMAVIIQEVVGLNQGDRFYPNISGVGRSYNFYPTGRAKPEDGIVNLALGLGKTIVDGGLPWSYSPAHPKIFPPYGSPRDLLKQTQTTFWAVNMGKIREYDPVKETEYLAQCNLGHAEMDGTLEWLASTYDPYSDKIVLGSSGKNPKILTFAPILDLKRLPLNDLIKSILKVCKEQIGTDIEIEFALTFDRKRKIPPRFGFLQVRPMVVSDAVVKIEESELKGAGVLTASENVLGNGTNDQIRDIVYIDPSSFDSRYTQEIREELSKINRKLIDKNISYVLIGFGRWGSSDPWLGIPVNWSDINGAKVIIEATLPQMNPDLSQGSHFFHNITSFQVFYMSVKYSEKYNIDWEWLNQQPLVEEKKFVKHLKLDSPLTVKIDGRNQIGVILK